MDMTRMTRRFRQLRLGSVLLAGAALLAVAGCEGDNLFEGRPVGGGTPPQIISVAVPQEVRAGSRVDVRVRALARRGLARVDVRFRGAAVADQPFPITTASTDTVVVDTYIDVPLAAGNSQLRIEAYATDLSGSVSEIVGGTVTVLPSTLAFARAP
jgi:hypothetical protein